jgi:hypothetical protein
LACSVCALTLPSAINRCIAEELGEDSSAKFTFTLVKRPGAAGIPTPAGVRVEIRDPLAARIYLGNLGQVSSLNNQRVSSTFKFDCNDYAMLPKIAVQASIQVEGSVVYRSLYMMLSIRVKTVKRNLSLKLKSLAHTRYASHQLQK